MKRLFVAVGLAAVCFVLAPIASASAEPFVGTCTFHGVATFENPTKLKKAPPLPPLPWELQKYKFKSKEAVVEGVKVPGVRCVDANTKEVEESNVEGAATVEGKGKLSCAVSAGGYLGEEVELPNGSKVKGTGPEGAGTLTLPKAGTKSFGFKFVGGGTEVKFTAQNKGGTTTATGEASFAKDVHAVAQCSATSTEEPEELEFDASAAGAIGE